MVTNLQLIFLEYLLKIMANLFIFNKYWIKWNNAEAIIFISMFYL
ncbi:hypothetical protein XBKQ1_890011 [Xenorhabdus bovienii str. kraussei Quebec]|uniref:Uncharacterized protein n=1 Tax=Xenorhabdus bovienii str. kraussei Quebec TaxID=1398203 RepID=A0A077PQH4_XENBV|nr:hypothetical protein XBKQ1_890011 [Xenorhabdus bovienii str. kraussei Quebec]